MPRNKQYATTADRMRAYRQRQAERIAARANERATSGLPAAPAVSSIPATPRWKGLIDQAHALLEQARSEMQTYHDERTERWQEGEKGAEFADRLQEVTEIVDSVETLQEHL